MSRVCDACGETFRTLTRLRLHEKDDCPERETFDELDPNESDVGVQAAEGLLTCRDCDRENPNANFEETADFDGDDYHLIVEFDCRHCGFENENRVVMTGIDRDDLENLPPHLRPDDDVRADGGFHSGNHHVLYDDGVAREPEPALEDLCTEDGCTDEALLGCGCCGMPLCGRHHEVQGGFCSHYARVADVPGCLVWGDEFYVYPRAFYDGEAAVLVAPESTHDQPVFHLEENGAPICRPVEDSKESAAIQDLNEDHELCDLCEKEAVDRLAEDQEIATDGGQPVGGTDREHHPCEELDYHALYRTLLRSASTLAEYGEYEAADELWASAQGVRTEVEHCRSLHTDTDSTRGEQR